MESSARTEKKELLRWWWWWWWLRSTRKGFEGEECHCCCLEFVEFTIKNGTSPLDWSSTSLNTPLNLPFTSIKALIATSVILFLSYHAYTNIHINLSCQAETPFVFKEFLILGTTKTATKAIAKQKNSPDRRRSRITNPICLIPQNSRSMFWQVSILESLSQVLEKGWDPSPGVWCSRSLEHLTLIQWRHCWPPERACWSSPTSCLALFVFLPSPPLLFLLTRQHGSQEIRVLQTPKTLTLILWWQHTNLLVEATYLPEI